MHKIPECFEYVIQKTLISVFSENVKLLQLILTELYQKDLNKNNRSQYQVNISVFLMFFHHYSKNFKENKKRPPQSTKLSTRKSP